MRVIRRLLHLQVRAHPTRRAPHRMRHGVDAIPLQRDYLPDAQTQ
jgi:hypothetical protein